MVLVTGCNTLIGKQIVKKLLEKKIEVIGYEFYKPSSYPYDIKIYDGKLNNVIGLEKICKGVETIIHLLDVKLPSDRGRKFMKSINITGTDNLLKAATKTGVSKFLHLSTYEVYGKQDKIPVRQDDKLKPKTKYGKDKLKSEKIVWQYSQNEHISTTIFRPTLVIGSETEDATVLTTLYIAMGLGNSNKLYFAGNGDTRFQLLHPEDAAEAFYLALKSNKSINKLYNLGSDNVPTQIEQIVRLKDAGKLDCSIINLSKRTIKLISFLLKPLKLHYLSKNHINYLLGNIILDTQRIKRDLHWKAEKNNIDILIETINWYQQEKIPSK